MIVSSPLHENWDELLASFQLKVYLGDESRGPYRSTYCETYVLEAKREGILMQVHSRTKYLFHE